MKRRIEEILYLLPAAGWTGAFFLLLFERSEGRNALIGGLSGLRLGLAASALLGTFFSFFLFRNRRKDLTFLYYISGACGILSAEVLLFARFPCDNSRNLIPLAAERGRALLLAMLLCAAAWMAALSVSEKSKPPKHYGFFLFSCALAVYWGISVHIDRYNWRIDLQGNTAMCLVLFFSALLWQVILSSDLERGWKTAAGCLFFVLLGFCVTRSAAMWMGRGETPPKAYWNELAEAMLNGRLYLEHPSGTHDLTLYEGRWYVPNPPLPGILLILPVAVLGSAGAVNMVVYSAVIAGINAGLLYLMLILAFTRDRGPLSAAFGDDASYPGKSNSIAARVTVLFIFGTDHLWLGTTGQMWFISQLLVVTFTLTACICVICRFSPVWAGTALGLGILCRPNIFPVWLCLLGIRLHQERAFPRLQWKKTLGWCIGSGIPAVISAALLLLYNKVRFDAWMDFGYVTINGADWIKEAVLKYGMFHPHFIPVNINVMLFGLPRLDLSGERYFFQPHVAGYSVFLMTPPLLYCFRASRKNWAAAGSRAAVVLSIALLLLYHNTGAEQIGYRYILDITAPLALLTADGMRGKVSPLFRLLTVFSVLLSFTAIYWWYLGRV